MAVGELLVVGKMLSSFPQPFLSFDFCSLHNWNARFFFFQHSHFRRLMNSQISRRIVKTWRNKLQSVVHKITASWDSSTENLHRDGFTLTGCSQSSSVDFYWIVSLDWEETLRIDRLAVLWPLFLFSVRHPDRCVIWEVFGSLALWFLSVRTIGGFILSLHVWHSSCSLWSFAS